MTVCGWLIDVWDGAVSKRGGFETLKNMDVFAEPTGMSSCVFQNHPAYSQPLRLITLTAA